MIQKIGNRTFCFEEQPVIIGHAAVAGKKESEGPLSKFFDRIIYDPYDGLNSFEEAESRMQSEAVSLALEKSGISADKVDVAFAGDLLNQCTGSGFCLKDFGIPYLGQYGACSTMGQGLLMASLFVESGAAKNAVCATSSHFCSAERQYRFPLEYGSVRTPTAQWTVTGAGSCVVAKSGKGARVAHATVGKIIDLGITDANNMGAAMAPAMGIIEPYPVGQGRLLHQKSKRKELFRSGKFLNTRYPMEKLQQLIKEATIITYGEQGALRRQQLIETDRVQYHILLSEGNLYERIQQAEPEGES